MGELGALERDRFVSEASAHAAEVLGASWLAVWRLEGEGPPEAWAAVGVDAPVPGGPGSLEALLEPFGPSGLPDEPRAVASGALVVAPLRGAAGAVVAGRRAPRASFDDDDAFLLGAFAEQVAATLRRHGERGADTAPASVAPTSSGPVSVAAPRGFGGARPASVDEALRPRPSGGPASPSPARYRFEDIVAVSPAMCEVVALARQAASVDANVLLVGESGTGKEVLAQAIHAASARAPEPFVGVNCAALPAELLEAELFGYERGAFTGARREGSAGKFEQAGRGTLLLDEIGDMPAPMQPKLLRVLQERLVTRLGGGRERPVPARIVATTHRDLREAVQSGQFRLDLFYRLGVLALQVPALRDRPDDVLPLAERFLVRFAAAQGKAVRVLGEGVVRALAAHAWPGNVRELANVIEREVSLLPAEAESLERLRVSLSDGPGGSMRPAASRSSLPPSVIPLVEVERRAFLEALSVCGGSVSRAARALGVSKVTFYAKLRRWGLHPTDGPASLPSSVLPAADAPYEGEGDAPLSVPVIVPSGPVSVPLEIPSDPLSLAIDVPSDPLGLASGSLRPPVDMPAAAPSSGVGRASIMMPSLPLAPPFGDALQAPVDTPLGVPRPTKLPASVPADEGADEGGMAGRGRSW